MSDLRILHPLDGDVLTHNDGTETTADLTILVHGTSPACKTVTVNGIEAQVDGNEFICQVPLTAKRNKIVAQCGDCQTEITVFWVQNSQKRYRFSVDDNIQFLKDLGTAPDKYPSLFDHWYLKFWRQMNREYGAKIHLNIYYQTDGFDLTQMPDIWKDEWIENSWWLHLSFHALQDKPDRPYRNATYSQLAHDYDLVTGHIRRFAGNEMIGTTTTVHWGECPLEARFALRDRGMENLIGLFFRGGGDGDSSGCTTGYQLPLEVSDYIDTRDAWYEKESGMFMVTCDQVVNCWSVEEIPQLLDKQAASPHTGEMIELLIHEQYFREDLPNYQPTILQKVTTALDWVTRNGYEPVFWSEGFLGGHSPL